MWFYPPVWGMGGCTRSWEPGCPWGTDRRAATSLPRAPPLKLPHLKNQLLCKQERHQPGSVTRPQELPGPPWSQLGGRAGVLPAHGTTQEHPRALLHPASKPQSLGASSWELVTKGSALEGFRDTVKTGIKGFQPQLCHKNPTTCPPPQTSMPILPMEN
jgi:hypothetical protein